MPLLQGCCCCCWRYRLGAASSWTSTISRSMRDSLASGERPCLLSVVDFLLAIAMRLPASVEHVRNRTSRFASRRVIDAHGRCSVLEIEALERLYQSAGGASWTCGPPGRYPCAHRQSYACTCAAHLPEQ